MPFVNLDSTVRTNRKAFAASVTHILINMRLTVNECNRLRRAMNDADLAGLTDAGNNLRLNSRMLVKFTAPSGQAHGNILYGAAVTSQQMSGAMGQSNNHINPFNQSGNVNPPGLVSAIRAPWRFGAKWNRNLILTNKPVSNDYRTAQILIGKPMPVGQGQMVHRINPRALIKRVGVGNKWFGFGFLDQVNNNLNEYR